MSTSTLARTPDPGDDFDRIVEGFDDPARPRFVKSRTEIMTVRDAINTSMGRRRHRTREREA
jgi:hypothetical protein